MDIAEWPLVAFTVVIQMAAGLLILSELACLAGGGVAKRLLFRREVLCFLLGAVGMLISLGHLGNPFHSPFTILNAGTSWLSREILCTSFFVGTLAVLSFTRYRAAFAAFSPIVAAVSCLAGLATIFVMARVYMIVTVPSWNTPATMLNFLGTALLLGSLAAGLLACLRWSRTTGTSTGEQGSFGRTIGLILFGTVLGLGLKFIEIPLDLLAGAQTNARGISGISALLAAGLPLLVTRLVLPVLAAALFVWAMAGAFKKGAAGLPTVVTTSALVFALAGEVIGRFFFYSMHVLVGL